jgi:hypothetical protein
MEAAVVSCCRDDVGGSADGRELLLAVRRAGAGEDLNAGAVAVAVNAGKRVGIQGRE